MSGAQAAPPEADGDTGSASPSGIPIRNIWHMLLYAWGEAGALERWRREAETAPSLDVLLATVLAQLVEQRLRVGLARGYQPEARAVAGIRGRIDFSRSLKTLEFERGRAFCRFHEFTSDIPRNRLVRAVLERLVAVGAFGPHPNHADALRRRLRRLLRDLDEITPIQPHVGALARETSGRNDGDYRLMLAICDLVLRRTMPTEEEGGKAGIGLDRDTLTLHRVFERFVAAYLQMHLDGWQVTPQKPLEWPTAERSLLMPGMQVDIVLHCMGSGRLIMIDTKFTPGSLVRTRFGGERFQSGHLYQMYAYLRSQEEQSPSYRSAEGVLLYPAASWHLSEKVEIQGHVLRVETLDLARPWIDVETDLQRAATGEVAMTS